jgi:outer membrane immunogenic protein
MKQIIVAAAAALLFASGSAVAADLPTKAPYYKANRPYFGWTGCYIGVQGGGAWGHAQTKVATTGEPFQPRFDIDGGIFGGEWGCNYQFAGNWVFGYEGDFSWTDKKGTALDGHTAGNSAIPITIKETWISTQRARLGVAWDRTLFYVTGGVAFARVEWSGLLQPPAFGSTFVARDAHTFTGGVVGGGIEHRLWNNLSIKAEYLFVDFGHKTICPTTCATPFGPFAARNGFVTDHIVRAGLNWQFGGLY